MDMSKIKSFAIKYKWHLLFMAGAVVVFLVMRKGGSGSTTVIEGQSTYSEGYLLQAQGMANQLTLQANEIQGNLGMQSLVNRGQLDLANVQGDSAKYLADVNSKTSMYTSDANVSVASISADAQKVVANFGYMASKADADSRVSVANAQANAQIKASEYNYLLGVDTNEAQMYISDNSLKEAQSYYSAQKSVAKTNAWGGVLNTLAQGWGGGYIASNAKGW